VSAAAGGLRARVLTALVLAVVLVSVLFALPAWATLALILLAVLAGAWEWSAFLRLSSAGSRVLYVVAIAALLGLAAVLTRDAAVLRAFLVVVCAWWLCALAWLALAPQRVGALSAAVAGALALVPAGIALIRLRSDPQQGPALTLFAVLLIVAADLGAFFAGRAFGRVKLAPRVSPGKTWEGVLGGLLLALAVGAAGAAWFGLPLLGMLPVSLAVAAFSVVGDLTESMLKRHSGIKDSGTLFPGHGGMLDRIDSICAGAPVLLLGLMQIEVIQ
jgi:phosphatidate cytidylyltransferase